MTRRPRLAPLSAALTIAVAFFACSGCRRPHFGADAGDAGLDAGDAGDAAAFAVDASPPPDDAIPQPSPEELSVRARHLLEAIGRDDAQLATDIVFPRDGWLAARDAPDPGKDWEKRLLGPLRRGIHALSRRHPDYEHAQSVSLELGHAMVQQSIHRHGWKEPLWSVRDSRLTFVVDGRTRTLTIREMTAWRGAWYVTRLR
jgi:hypothetical protein